MTWIEIIFLNGVCTMWDFTKNFSHKAGPISRLMVELVHLKYAGILNLIPRLGG